MTAEERVVEAAKAWRKAAEACWDAEANSDWHTSLDDLWPLQHDLVAAEEYLIVALDGLTPTPSQP